MTLSLHEREQFLAEPHIGALSVVERPDRAPLTVPIWYERTQPSVRYVWVEGPVTRTAPDSRERSWEMAARYLPQEKVAAFVEYDREHLGEHFLVHMRPEHWAAADLGAF
ncbi:hypothetical protein [Streptomyces sp. NRRL S-1022]|uniref:hypothetical protein n=1 Tax=Streptomyces sp. NRRL S-1022 TaxID=1463880 RepID=UPI0004BEEF81|nr:hypothetical protein [Streptomyces sp. NRRL S-1022]